MKKSMKLTMIAALALGCVGGGVAALGGEVTTASAEAKALEFNFVMPYQNPDWGLNAGQAITAFSVKGLENVNLKTGQYTVNGKNYVYVSDDVDSEGADKGNGVYGVENRGGNGWAVINLNTTGTPARITLKSGFNIVVGEDTYTLAEDYALFFINNAYVPGKTFEEALAKASTDLTVDYTEADITTIGAIDGSKNMIITYDTNLPTSTGALSYVDWSKITGDQGGTIGGFGGYVRTPDLIKTLQYRTVTTTFQEGEKVTIPAGFMTAFWDVSDKTKVYVVKTKTEKVLYYVDGGFTANNPLTAREALIKSAKATNTYYEEDIVFAASKTGFTNRGAAAFTFRFDNPAVQGLATKTEADPTAGYLYISNEGYVAVDDQIVSDKAVKQMIRNADWGTIFNTLSNEVCIDVSALVEGKNAQKVTLKKGFLVATTLADGKTQAVELKNDYSVYNVDGYWLPAASLDELQTMQFSDSVTVVENTFDIDGFDIHNGMAIDDKGVSFDIANWDISAHPDKNDYPGGHGSYVNGDFIQINGTALSKDAIWHLQYNGDAGFRVSKAKIQQIDGLEEANIPNLIPEGEEFGTFTFKKGLTLVFINYETGEDNHVQLEFWTLENDFTGWFDAEGNTYRTDPMDSVLPDLDEDGDDDTTSDDTSTSSSTSEGKKKKGCSGSLALGGMLLPAMAIAAVAFARKRRKE